MNEREGARAHFDEYQQQKKDGELNKSAEKRVHRTNAITIIIANNQTCVWDNIRSQVHSFRKREECKREKESGSAKGTLLEYKIIYVIVA